VFLGSNGNKLPNEPLLLGNKTTSLLSSLINELYKFAAVLKSTVSTPAGTPLVDVNMAATQLTTKLDSVLDKLDGLTSSKVYAV